LGPPEYVDLVLLYPERDDGLHPDGAVEVGSHMFPDLKIRMARPVEVAVCVEDVFVSFV